MNKKQMLKLARCYAKRVDWCSFRDDVASRAKGYYYGSMPLDMLLLCMNISDSNCLLMSTWLMELYPDATFVEGSCESYRHMQGAKNQKPCPGYHVWIEHNGKVYDPGTLLAMDKEVFYKLEKASVLRTAKYDKVFSDLAHLKPSKQPCENKYDKLRQFLILIRIEELVDADNWLYKEQVKEIYTTFAKSLDKQTIKKCWNEEFNNIAEENLPKVSGELFLGEKYAGPMQGQQKAMANIIIDQFENLSCMQPKAKKKNPKTGVGVE